MKAKRRLSSRIDQRLAVGLVLAALVGVITARSSIVFDDAYILFRYARNLVDSYGWTFNPGLHTADAATSPLLVLLLAGLTFAGLGMLAASGLLFAVGMWSAGWFTFLALRRTHPVPAVVAGMLVVTAPPLVMLRGMESAVSLGLIALALWAFLERHDKTLGVAVGLAVLARPDNVLLGLLLLAVLVWQRRRVPWAGLACAAAVVMPWVVFSSVWVGGLLPDTLGAKQAQLAAGWPSYLENLILLPYYSDSGLWFVVLVPLAFVGLWLGRTSTFVRLVVALGLMYGVAYALLGVVGYSWYYAVPMYALCVLAPLSLRSLQSWVLAAPVALLVVALGVGLTDAQQMPPGREGYRAVSAWLSTHAAPSDMVATEEIGVIGYYGDVRIFDYMGLLDKRAWPHLRARDFSWWAQSVEPRFFVGHRKPWTTELNLQTDPWFSAHYRQVFSAGDSVVYERGN